MPGFPDPVMSLLRQRWITDPTEAEGNRVYGLCSSPLSRLYVLFLGPSAH